MINKPRKVSWLRMLFCRVFHSQSVFFTTDPWFGYVLKCEKCQIEYYAENIWR